MKKLPSILLVDDDETTNYINKLIITRAGLTDELLIAQNGKDALELLQDRSASGIAGSTTGLPQLILLDINMPVMDGFKFLDVLKDMNWSQEATFKIAVLTTSLDPRDIEKVKKLGVTEFLNKPLTRESLENLIGKYFN